MATVLNKTPQNQNSQASKKHYFFLWKENINTPHNPEQMHVKSKGLRD